MAYRLKRVSYQDRTCHVLLQNENGPCPLIAAANALILRGALALNSSSVRSNVISIEDLVHELANFALQRHAAVTESSAAAATTSGSTSEGEGGGKKESVAESGAKSPESGDGEEAKVAAAEGEDEAVRTRQKHQERHVDEMMSLLPGLQYGLDVNPKFTQGPDGCEYTVGLTTFDVLGVDLVHGWLVDPQDKELHAVLQSKSYNELVDLIIHGNEADAEVENLTGLIKEKEGLLERAIMNGWVDVPPSAATPLSPPPLISVGKDEGEAKESEAPSHPATAEGKPGGVTSDKEDAEVDEPLAEAETSANTSNDQSKTDVAVDEAQEGAKAENFEKVELPSEQDTDSTDAINPDLEKTKLSRSPSELEKEIADLKSKLEIALDKATKGHLINSFLNDTGHQLTYHGLEKLHQYMSEGSLCVFFRNNHFSTIVKNDGKLFLLVTDLGYANAEDVVWERLDVIDGDTDYVDCVFKDTRPQSVMAPSAPILNPEQVLSQKGQNDLDYQLAVRLQNGKSINDTSLDDEEAALIAAATEESLNTYHTSHSTDNHEGTKVPLPPPASSKTATPQQSSHGPEVVPDSIHSEESDRAMALALQAQFENDGASEILARRLQEEERRRVNQSAGGGNGAARRTANPPARDKSGCTIS